MITSRGNRKPVNAERGGKAGRTRQMRRMRSSMPERRLQPMQQSLRATELRPGEDRGTAVTTGLTTNRFELVNTFYIAFDEHRDEVTPIITRAMALLDED